MALRGAIAEGRVEGCLAAAVFARFFRFLARHQDFFYAAEHSGVILDVVGDVMYCLGGGRRRGGCAEREWFVGVVDSWLRRVD